MAEGWGFLRDLFAGPKPGTIAEPDLSTVQRGGMDMRELPPDARVMDDGSILDANWKPYAVEARTPVQRLGDLGSAVLPLAGGMMAPVAKAAGETVLGAGPIRAYHGSPHDFDRFDLSKIGTGEGAQAYGHGLYFAEREGTARSYRDALSPPATIMVAGRDPLALRAGSDFTRSELIAELGLKWPENAPVALPPGVTPESASRTVQRLASHAVPRLVGELNGAAQQGFDVNEALTQATTRSFHKLADLRDALKHYERNPDAGWGELGDPKALRLELDRGEVEHVALEQLANALRGKVDVKPGGGRMYEVAIHADPDKLLAWDAPLPAKHPARDLIFDKTSAGLDSVYADTRNAAKDARFSAGREELTGAGAYLSLKKALAGDAPAASELLRENGIPGIKYADQQTRWGPLEKRTNNFVAFDDKQIEILKKYGLAGLAPAGLGAAAVAGQEDR
jgi:hypothetical protein